MTANAPPKSPPAPATELSLSAAPSDVRLIQLGEGGRWVRRALETGTIRFGIPSEPHDLCLQGDWDGVRRSLLASGKKPEQATQLRNQCRTFYQVDQSCLWITFAEQRLWWGFAEPRVIDLRLSGDDAGIVARSIAGGWSSRSQTGEDLLITHLDARVTKVRRFPGALCRVGESDAVWRTITAGFAAA